MSSLAFGLESLIFIGFRKDHLLFNLLAYLDFAYFDSAYFVQGLVDLGSYLFEFCWEAQKFFMRVFFKYLMRIVFQRQSQGDQTYLCYLRLSNFVFVSLLSFVKNLCFRIPLYHNYWPAYSTIRTSRLSC